MRPDPTNNTLLNTRQKVFGTPTSISELMIQALFTGYMLRFDSNTVYDQLYVSIDDNNHTKRLFNSAVKVLSAEYPAMLAVWSKHYE
jgi:hypothetical protein